MKKFLVYLLVIVCVVSMGFAIFYLVRDNEVISVTHASMYVDKGQNFDIEVKHKNKKKSTEINITTSSESIVKIVSGKAGVSYMAVGGGVARVNFRTSNVRYRNLWCDVIVGDGSEENPFYISSAEQLAQIGQSDAYGLDKSYKLVNDIDMSEVDNGIIKPAGDFTGVFDGNGYTISNIILDEEAYNTNVGSNTQNAVNASARAQGSFTNVGFFSRIMQGAKFYNVKFDNVYINGSYETAGVVAGVNYGTIERVAVTNAVFNLTGNTSNFYGGIVGLNESTEENGRNIARIDRCSVSGIWGKGYNEENQLVNNGITGTIGGLTGKNIGGVVIYSFAEGSAVFGNADVIYGGLVGVNNYIEFANATLFDDNNQPIDKFVGGNVKDSYAYITTFMNNGNLSANVYGGVIGKVYDYYVTKVINEESSKVATNLIVGLYYENELLNTEQEGITTKALTGIGEYYADTTGSSNNKFNNFKDSRFVVMAKENGDIEFTDKYSEQFESHEKVEQIFDEKGEYVETERTVIYWPFSNVWNQIEESEDKNFPILNYGRADYTDGFDDLGNAVITETANGSEIKFVQGNYVPQINVDTYDVTLIMFTHPTTQLRATPSNLTYKWSSSDESVVTVDVNTGKVTAQSVGSAIITATLQSDDEKGIVGGTTASCVVTVKAPDFELNPSTRTIKVGEEFNLSPSIENLPVKYSSSNTQYAVVDNNGKVTAIGLPKNENSVNVTITAEYMGRKANCVVTIVGEDLGLNYLELNIRVNEQVQLSEVNGLKVTWASLNNEIATVSSNGLVTGKKVGITYVTATSVYGDVVTCRVTVTSAELLLTTNNVTLNEGESVTVKVANPETDNVVVASWESENENIAIVNNGVITGVSEGITRVVATSTEGNVAYVVVRVNTNETIQYNLYFTETVYTVSAGSNVTLKYEKSPAGQTVTFSSDNTSVATVNNSGVVTGKAGGKAIITANLVVDGRIVISAKALVYVIEIVEEDEFIIFNSTSVILTRIGESYQLQYETNVDSSITFASSNTNVATVSNSGVITAVGAGTATITASANGKVLAECTVVISIQGITTPPVDNYTYKVDIKKPIFNINMEVGGKKSVYATTYGTDGAANISEEDIVWETSDKSVVTVADTNKIVDNIFTLRCEKVELQAIGAGTATITAKIVRNGQTKAISSRTVTVVKNFDNYISSVEELDAMREMKYSFYYLVANIDLAGYDWEPIGTVAHPFNRNFTAKFNGVRYSINNLNVDATNNSNQMYGGLFGYLGLCADIRYVTLNNVTVSGYQVAGSIAGFNNGSIRYARVNNVTISSAVAAGGIAGINDSRIFNCTVSGGSLTLNTNDNNCGVGGIAGINKCIVATVNVLGLLNICGNSGATVSVNVGGVCGHNTGSVTDAVVNTTGEIYLDANDSGNIGGIAGTSQGSIYDAYFSGKVTASTTNKNVNVGGIVGYFIGGALDVVYKVAVKAANIVGYAAGGIAGVINSTQKFLLNVTKYGLGELDLISHYAVNFNECAVDGSVNIKGAVAGGIASLINGGVVLNSYAQAKISGVDATSIIAGLVAEIQAHLNYLNYGTAGLMKQCYSACTFSGAGKKYAVTSSDVHVEGSSRGSAGFIMNYLWDSTVSKGASAPANNWRKNADYLAKTTTDALKQMKTYTNQLFEALYWNFSNGYAQLKNIKFDTLNRTLND